MSFSDPIATPSKPNATTAKNKGSLLLDVENLPSLHPLLKHNSPMYKADEELRARHDFDGAYSLDKHRVKSSIQMYAVKMEGGFVFPSSYEGLFMDFLNRNNKSETLDSGLERRSVGVKKSPTGESFGEKARALFLYFILFAFVFTDIYFFYPFDLLYILDKKFIARSSSMY